MIAESTAWITMSGSAMATSCVYRRMKDITLRHNRDDGRVSTTKRSSEVDGGYVCPLLSCDPKSCDSWPVKTRRNLLFCIDLAVLRVCQIDIQLHRESRDWIPKNTSHCTIAVLGTLEPILASPQLKDDQQPISNRFLGEENFL